MKKYTTPVLIPLMLLAAVMAACKPSDSDSQASSSSAASDSATAGSDPYAVAADAKVDKEVEITADDQMKFNIEFFDVEPGQVVSLTLKNIGSMPKMSMGHNLVVLKQKTDEEAFVQASMNAPTTDYVPEDHADEIIVHTKLLGPGESDTIKFKAPTKKGRYTFICSFPGHYQVGMKGKMVVK